MTRRRAIIAIGAALVIVVLACIAAWLYLSGPRLTPSVHVKTPPPEPEYALELVRALNDYYNKKGEYPPYLPGGLLDGLGLGEAIQFSDPLIESGVLKSYPIVLKHRIGMIIDARIQNIVSSPNDPYVVYLRNKYKDKALDKARQPETQVDPEIWDSLPEGTNLVSEVERAFSHERYFCGGGVETLGIIGIGGSHGLEVRGKYEVIPDTYQFVDSVGNAISFAEGYVDLMFFSVESEFGYQRGEYVGEDKQACWIWFYSDEPQRINYLDAPDMPKFWLIGLDLVDTDDGLIQPDGIPDGIVLLYKLKDGKIIEVVKDYD